jgi:hypothetical protein
MPKKAKQTISKATRRAPKKRPPQRKTAAEQELKLRRHPESNELFVLPVAALVMDSVILDNQESHLVLTIRIPKAVIRNNTPLLKGLIDEGRLSRRGGCVS